MQYAIEISAAGKYGDPRTLAELSSQTPYDISIGGRERGADWEQERDHIKQIAAAGATWWREAIPCGELDEMQERIKRGPLRID